MEGLRKEIKLSGMIAMAAGGMIAAWMVEIKDVYKRQGYCLCTVEFLMMELYRKFISFCLFHNMSSFPTTIYLWAIFLTASKELSILLLKLY